MDLNDIRARTTRIYISIGLMAKGASHDDIYIEEGERIDENGVKWKTKAVKFREDGASEVLVNSVIDNLAHLKDPLKERMKALNQDPKLIEQEIDNNDALCILIDLANAAKHTYPLKKTKRSKLDPKIHGVEKVFSFSRKKAESEGVRMIEEDGSISKDLRPCIFSEIIDSNGHGLMTLDQLIERSCLAWESIIAKYKLT